MLLIITQPTRLEEAIIGAAETSTLLNSLAAGSTNMLDAAENHATYSVLISCC